MKFERDPETGLMVPRRVKIWLPHRERELSLLTGPAFFGSAAPSDLYPQVPFANVVLLLHMDGAHGLTSWDDVSTHNHTVTRVGNTVVDDAVKLFDDNSTLFDGNGDILQIPDHADWAFGTDEWRVEVWIYPTDDSGPTADRSLLGSAVGTGFYPINIRIGSGGGGGLCTVAVSVSFANNTTATLYGTVKSISLNAWHHVLVCRIGNTFYAFVDTVEIGAIVNRTVSTLAIFDAAAPLCIGNYSVDYNAGSGPLNAFQGRLRELRISRGAGVGVSSLAGLPIARYPDS